MIPGEILPANGSITLNEGLETVTLTVANTGDRPVQVGSCLLYTSPSPRDMRRSRMPSSA